MRHGEHPLERKFSEAIIDKSRNGFAHHSASPKLFAQPVTELRGMLMNIFARSQAEAANGRAIDFDAKVFARQTGDVTLEKIFRVFDRVGMRKGVA